MNLIMGEVSLRYVVPGDATLILRLRAGAVARQTLSAGAVSLESQQQWIRAYQKREAGGREHYFIIALRDVPVGAVRIYAIESAVGTFTWGSWVIQEGTAPVVAWISAVMVYDFAFSQLGLQRAAFEVAASNHNVIRFHQNFGATIEKMQGGLVSFALPKAHYFGIRKKFLQRISRSSV